MEWLPLIAWTVIGFAIGIAFLATGLRDAIKDAKRYRWIRDSCPYEIQATRATLDSAIDAAMARDREG